MPSSPTELIKRQSHSQRQALTEEMHGRQFPAFVAPARVLQLVILISEAEAEASRHHARALCEAFGASSPVVGRYTSVALGDRRFFWEQHSEFATYTLIVPGAFADPFSEPLHSVLPVAWLAELPGPILRATQIALLSRSSPEPASHELDLWFRPDELVSCDVLGGEARIWSNYRVHEDGLGRLLIRDRSLTGDGDPSRLVQRLQELGNYRNAALLGLPVAQRLTPSLSQLERRLAALSAEIARGGARDEVLMYQLSFLSAELAGLTAETSYRMSASKAYAQIVSDRLRDLGIVRVPGFQTLSDFTERRLTPAIRTCQSFSQRCEELSARAAWASSLLRARIETALERQNGDLLASMNRRAHLQLRLQQTVEGLSVIAISYYAVGVLGYCAKATAHFLPGFDPNIALGVLALPIVVAVWLLMRRLHRSLETSASQPGPGEPTGGVSDA
ncbi:MAG TPA: DUF3422 domain-containing protein [Steroidobacteraceae bacterium]|nr:DUF3422 domain-containing protein [Steroidobacteraceae bacterium]